MGKGGGSFAGRFSTVRLPEDEAQEGDVREYPGGRCSCC